MWLSKKNTIFVLAIKLKEMEQEKLTVRQIRRALFESEKGAILGSRELTNKESRDFLYNLEDQEKVMNVIDTGNLLVIFS